jgi:hypothetical protein
LSEKLLFCGRVLESLACVTLVRKAADEMRIAISFRSFGENKIDWFIIASKKLTNNFAG